MSAEQIVTDADKVTSHFGRWPHFHDMEVVSIFLDRRGPGAPRVEFTVFAWTYTGRPTPDGFFEQQLHALIRFCCESVTANDLNGFNHQNVLDGLLFAADGDSIRVTFPSIFGLGGFIECRSVRVLELICATPQGEPADEK